MATFSEEELQAAVDSAVAEATAPLKSRITELETTHQQSEWETAKADLDTKIADLESKLDAAVVEVTQAKEAKEAVEQAWAEEKQAGEEATAMAARREERLQKVREMACFPEEYVEQNGDRFAAMSDDDFSARLDEWAALAKTGDTGKGNGEVPKKTALTAARQEQGGDESSLGLLREFRRVMTDPRTL